MNPDHVVVIVTKTVRTLTEVDDDASQYDFAEFCESAVITPSMDLILVSEEENRWH